MKQCIGLLALALACGGTVDGDEEFVQLEQEYTSANGFGFNVGVSGSQTRCASSLQPPSSSQICLLPPDYNVTVRITNDGIGASEKAALESIATTALASWDSQIDSAWALSLITSGNGDVNVRYGTLSGGPLTAIHAFARLTIFNGGSNLTEAVPVNGVWRHYSGTQTCTIDKAKIDANWSNQLQRDRVRSHALYYCMQKAMGLGSGGAVTKTYAIAVTPDNAKDLTLGNRVKCFFQKSGGSNNGTIGFSSDCDNVTDN